MGISDEAGHGAVTCHGLTAWRPASCMCLLSYVHLIVARMTPGCIASRRHTLVRMLSDGTERPVTDSEVSRLRHGAAQDGPAHAERAAGGGPEAGAPPPRWPRRRRARPPRRSRACPSRPRCASCARCGPARRRLRSQRCRRALPRALVLRQDSLTLPKHCCPCGWWSCPGDVWGHACRAGPRTPMLMHGMFMRCRVHAKDNARHSACWRCACPVPCVAMCEIKQTWC